MNETLSTTLVVQLEAIAGQFLRARLLEPWRSQVVGRDWKDVEAKLRVKAAKELAAPFPASGWLMITLPSCPYIR